MRSLKEINKRFESLTKEQLEQIDMNSTHPPCPADKEYAARKKREAAAREKDASKKPAMAERKKVIVNVKKKKQRKTAFEREQEYMTMKASRHEISEEELSKWLDERFKNANFND